MRRLTAVLGRQRARRLSVDADPRCPLSPGTYNRPNAINKSPRVISGKDGSSV
jgi:hypothetical protein